MPNEFTIQLDAASQEALRRLSAVPAELGQRIARAIDLQNELTIGHAQANKMSQPGPETLGVRTNRLRSSLRRSTATVGQGLVVTSSIGTNVKYAAVHEYGFEGDVQVKAHSRRVNKVFGRPLRSPATAHVKAFQRHMSLPQRSFIGSSIGERLDDYQEAIAVAIEE